MNLLIRHFSWSCGFLLKPFICLSILLSIGCSEQKRETHQLHTVNNSASLTKHFNQQIISIFENRCSVACHGVDKNSYQQFLQKDPINKIAFYFPYDVNTGKIDQSDYELTYQVAVGNHRVDYSEKPHFSHLVRAPLTQEYGGQPHRGLDVFYSSEDKDYQTLINWLKLDIDENKLPSKELPENIAYFKEHILGVMERNSCFLSSCHDSQVFNDLKLIPPLPSDDIGTASAVDSGFSTDMVLKNRKVVLGTVSRLVNLGGDLTKSRLITKNLPISEGGIHQRGGNTQFFESLEDADVKLILNWLTLERKALADELTSENTPVEVSELGKINGLVFIRGPRHTPRKWFSFDQYYPGSDIFLLPLKEGETLDTATSQPINITSAFHQKPVEIQSLDVRYDAKRVVFSMRTSADKGFRLYELQLDESFSNIIGEPKQLSFAGDKLTDGTLIHHIDPIYMPGPTDKKGHELADVAITFASNEAGHYAHSDAWGIIGEADSNKGAILFDKQRPEAAGTFNGKRIHFVEGSNEGQWRIIKKHLAQDGKGNGAQFVLNKPLPHPVDRKNIYVIEKSKAQVQSSFDIWRFIPESVDFKVKDSSHKQVHNAGHEITLSAKDLNGLSTKQRYEKSLVQVTYTHAQERRPTTRTTGETMFTSVRNIGYQGDKPIFNGAIYRVQAGGFDYHIQGGNRSGYALFSDSREMGNGLEVRQLHDPRNYWGGGMLTLSDHGFGINAEPDNPMDDTPYSVDEDKKDIPFSSPTRFIPAQVNLFDEYGEQAVTHTGISPGGSVRDPYPLLNGVILTSFTPNELNHLDKNADPDWDIYSFEFNTSPHSQVGDKAGEFSRVKIAAASSEQAEYSARPLMVRLKEKVEAPIHHQKFGSRSLAQAPKEELGILRMQDGLPGEIECYDYPLLQSFLTNFAPVGAKDFRIQQDNPDGSITPDERLFKYVRVIMQQPSSKAQIEPIFRDGLNGDPFASKVSLGVHNQRVIVAEVPIEDDGSFYVEVPTNVPLIVQGLNQDKMAMHGMNRWVYLQPGEKLTFGIPRSIYPLRCAGCHGSLSGEPLDGIGPADLVSASSRVMATWNFAEQKRRPAFGFDRKAQDYIGVDFLKDVQPILNNRCVGCHNNSPNANSKANSKLAEKVNLDLRDVPTKHYNIAYESLHQLSDAKSGNYADKKYINEREALSSESLLLQSLNGEKAKQHLQGEALSEQELLTLIRWVDLGATFIGATTVDEKTTNQNTVAIGEMN